MKPTPLFLQLKEGWVLAHPNPSVVSQNVISESAESRAHCLGTSKIAKQEEPPARVSFANQMALKKIDNLKVIDSSDRSCLVLGGTVSAEKVRDKFYFGKTVKHQNTLEIQKNNAQRDFPNLYAALLRPRIGLLELSSEQTQSSRVSCEDILDLSTPAKCNPSDDSMPFIWKSTKGDAAQYGSQDFVKKTVEEIKADLASRSEELRKHVETKGLNDRQCRKAMCLKWPQDVKTFLEKRAQQREKACLRNSRYIEKLKSNPEKFLAKREAKLASGLRYRQNLKNNLDRLAKEKEKARQRRLRRKERLKNKEIVPQTRDPEILLAQKEKKKARSFRYRQKIKTDPDRLAKEKEAAHQRRLRWKEKLNRIAITSQSSPSLLSLTTMEPLH